MRQRLNGAFFEALYIDDEPPPRVVHDTRRPPFDEFPDAADVYERHKAIAVGEHSNGENQTPTLADNFPVSVSSQRVLVEDLDRLMAIASWNYEQDYHGPETPTGSSDLEALRAHRDVLAQETEAVERAIRAEVQAD